MFPLRSITLKIVKQLFLLIGSSIFSNELNMFFKSSILNLFGLLPYGVPDPSSIFAIVLLPKLVAVYYPDVNVTVGYTIWNPGFWFFTEGKEVFDWVTFEGLVITQLDTNLVSAIIGMYFGGSLVKGK